MYRKGLLVLLALSLVMVLGYKGKGHVKKSEKGAQSKGEQVSELKDFVLTDHEGKEVKLSESAGKVIVLEWMNYDCPFVRAVYDNGTIPKLAKKYVDKGVVWLSINSTSYATVATNKAWAAKHELVYPVLDDRAGKVGRSYGATNTPQVFIMDKQGKTVYSGAVDNAPMGRGKGRYVNYADNALSELLAGKEVSTPKTKPVGCTVKYAK